MPLDIAKTLMATRYILFARYAIKFALIHLCFRNWKFSHSFLFKLRLAHFHTIGILLCFFCRWYNAISSTFRCHCVCSLKVHNYITHSRCYLSLFSKGNYSTKIEQGKKLFSLIDLSQGGDSLRNVFHETRI